MLSLLIVSSCGSSEDTEASTAESTSANAETATTEAAEAPDEAAGQDEVGFGELTEGTFILTGSVDEGFYTSDPELGFRLGGGCQSGQFGVSVNITDAAGETSFGYISAELSEDLSGGVVGEFAEVKSEVTVFPGGDVGNQITFRGPLRMIISEHTTGADLPLADQRMTITLLGSIPDNDGQVDVDITFQWVMGCP